MTIRTAIANLVTLRRAAAILVAVPSLLLFSPTAAHAATATPGTLRCEGVTTVIAHQPTVSVGASETAGYFAWLPALVALNVTDLQGCAVWRVAVSDTPTPGRATPVLAAVRQRRDPEL
jgi:hypothetical protein